MENIINFKVKKAITHEGTVSGYFVTTTNGEVGSNILAGIMKMFQDSEMVSGEQWKGKDKAEEEFFFPTDKELLSYMAYQLSEFKDKK